MTLDSGRGKIPTEEGRDYRLLSELSPTGMLWLINRQVFHPRGFALALVKNEDGEVIGWNVLGDGIEPWYFEGGTETVDLEHVNEFLKPHVPDAA